MHKMVLKKEGWIWALVATLDCSLMNSLFLFAASRRELSF